VNVKLAVTRLFSKSYKKTHPQKNLAKKTWRLAKETTFSLLLETDSYETSEDFLGSEQETPNSLLLHR